MTDLDKAIGQLEADIKHADRISALFVYIGRKQAKDILDLLKGQVARILSLEETIEGKNGLEIDPYVFVEIKGREDIFIGEINDASHYNYPNLSFGVGECFQINRSSRVSKVYLNTDYMKTVRCWTHKPSKEQRNAVKWE